VSGQKKEKPSLRNENVPLNETQVQMGEKIPSTTTKTGKIKSAMPRWPLEKSAREERFSAASREGPLASDRKNPDGPPAKILLRKPADNTGGQKAGCWKIVSKILRNNVHQPFNFRVGGSSRCPRGRKLANAEKGTEEPPLKKKGTHRQLGERV